jgi:hypothetical protein
LQPPNVALLAFRSSTDSAGRSATTRSLTGRACGHSESQRSCRLRQALTPKLPQVELTRSFSKMQSSLPPRSWSRPRWC